MAKKIKKKGRHASGQKDKRSPLPAAPNRVDIAKKLVVDREKLGFAEKKSCKHVNKGIDLEKVSTRIRKFGRIHCQDCRSASERRDKKGRNKQARSKGSVQESGGSDCIYICLACGHLSCGQSDPSNNTSHAYRHWHFAHHPIAVQWDNPASCWCFECNVFVVGDGKETEEGSDECGKGSGIVSDVLRLIKEHSMKDNQTNVEQVLVDMNARDNDEQPEIHENSVSECKEGRLGDGYAVKGLINLGNTCFFNSVMQNLLALDTLREYFMNVNMSNIGPVSSAMKKLYHETCVNGIDKEHRESSFGSRISGTINPKSLFNCICSKAPQFRGYQQQDSHELLRYLLDGLNSEDLLMKKSGGNEAEGEDTKRSDSTETFVDRIFGGQLSSTVSCLECGHSSVVYEPFLDLSLPVPMKRHPPEKATVVPSTKKPSSKAGNLNRGRRTREKGITVASPRLKNLSPDPTNNLLPPCERSSSKCSSSVPISEETAIQDEEFSWMDYVGPTIVSDESSCLANFDVSEDHAENYGCSTTSAGTEDNCTPATELAAHNFENHPVFEYEHQSSQLNSTNGTEIQVENNLSYQSELENEGTSRLPEECSTSSFCPGKEHKLLDYEPPSESRIIDELPLLVQDSQVLLLPYKELDSSPIDITEATNDPPNFGYQAYDNVPLEQLNVETSSMVAYEEKDADFDGLGDLFNEPEPVESGLASESLRPTEEIGMQDPLEMETILVSGNCTESNQEEVDDTNCPVSVDTCLIDFFKPELLSEEHAWNCENCAKIVNCQSQLDGQEQSTLLDSGEMPSKSEEDGDDSRTWKLHIVTDQSIVAASENVLQCHDVVDQDSVSKALLSNAHQNTDHAQLNDSPNDNVCGSEQLVATYVNVGQASKTKHRVSGKLAKSKGKKANLTDCKTVVMKRDATKRFLISKVPPVLTVHLKRFSQDARGRLSKLSGHINFQVVLDLSPYMDPRCKDKSCIYHLVGVVEHSGTMRGGHYVAYVRGQENRSSFAVAQESQSASVWHYISDNYVRQVSLREVLQSEAYILFYERHGK
ncbi:Ubiquitin carboxyl-terminal hydrolase 2 [Nymphaea thermarum]|nr:Ubiquitin carboxyl-terminal hydrolase 2 [Nymphaea thermarum]